MCTLDNSLIKEICSQNEKCISTCISRSSSNNYDEFQNLRAKFDTLLNNIIYEFSICSVVTGDFNAHNLRWWKNYIANSAGLELDSLTLSAAHTEIIVQCHALTLFFVPN